MKLILKNTTDLLLNISDLGIYLQPRENKFVDTQSINLGTSSDIIKYISNGKIVINDYHDDLLPGDAIKLITTNQLLPLDNEGKLFVHQTSRRTGTVTYWSGRGDKPDDINDIGNGEYLTISNFPGDPSELVKYMDLNTIDNETDIHEGYFFWENAKIGDFVSLSVVTNTVSYIPSAGTNFYLYNGFLVIPASGNGNIMITSDITNPCISGGSLVKVYTDETGYKPPAYWNADYNKSTGLFENIRPAPDGSGYYNMYTVELVGNRFINHIPLLGSGFERLQSSDSIPFPHGMRLKLEMVTLNDDHEWHLTGMMTMHRQKTYRL